MYEVPKTRYDGEKDWNNVETAAQKIDDFV